MAEDRDTVESLRSRLALARARLQFAGDPDGVIGFFKESQINTIMNQIIGDPRVLDGGPFRGLILTEEELVTQTRDAAIALANFRQHMADPKAGAKARNALAKFGSKITDAFNANLKDTVLSEALMPLGALLFSEAVKVFDPSLESRASAMFTVIDVRDDMRFPPDKFPDHDPLAPGDILHAETLIHAV